jgi:hypothetical protein
MVYAYPVPVRPSSVSISTNRVSCLMKLWSASVRTVSTSRSTTYARAAVMMGMR